MQSRAQKILEAHQQHTEQDHLTEDAAKDLARDISHFSSQLAVTATSKRSEAGYVALALTHGVHAPLDTILSAAEELGDDYYKDDVNLQRKKWLFEQVIETLDITPAKLRELERKLDAAFADKWPEELS